MTVENDRAHSLVDVGIPTYGPARYLRDAIESVLAQEWADWRLTVRENGPYGGASQAAVEPYLNDPRVRYVANGENVGQAENHTLLLKDATAPYVAILQEDDRWKPGFLSRRVALLDAHPEIALAFGGAVNIDENGNALWFSELVLPEGVHPPRVVLPLLFEYNCIGVPSRAVVRRRAYEAVGAAFDARFLYWDWEMWFRVAAQFSVAFAREHDTEYRVHAEQMTLNVDFDRQEMLRLLDHVESVIARYAPDVEISGRLRRRKRANLLLSQGLDDVQRGRRLEAARSLMKAVGRYPPAVIDPRVPVLLATLPLGSASERMLRSLRARVLRLGMQRGVRFHRHR